MNESSKNVKDGSKNGKAPLLNLDTLHTLTINSLCYFLIKFININLCLMSTD